VAAPPAPPAPAETKVESYEDDWDEVTLPRAQRIVPEMSPEAFPTQSAGTLAPLAAPGAFSDAEPADAAASEGRELPSPSSDDPANAEVEASPVVEKKSPEHEPAVKPAQAKHSTKQKAHGTAAQKPSRKKASGSAKKGPAKKQGAAKRQTASVKGAGQKPDAKRTTSAKAATQAKPAETRSLNKSARAKKQKR
jgi:hypothetical protein